MRTIFVGDVHGCAAELAELLAAAGYAASVDRLLLTGDAFARGPDPLGAWRIIRDNRAEMVLGNHDAGLLERLEAQARGDEPKLKKPDQRYTFAQLEPAHDDILTWLREVPPYIEDEAFLLVHAGLNPEQGLPGTTRDEFLAIRTWPPTKGIEGPRWHDHYRPDRPLLVFGHDAPGGLVVKERAGRPYLLGLDTGCVYGGRLTAYILEENRLVHVASQQRPDAWRHRDV